MKGARSSVANFLLGLLWLNFLVLWLIVRQATGAREAIDSVGLLGATIGVYIALLAGWIYHNIQIWRRKGPRTGLRPVSDNVKRDKLSREILPTVELKSNQEITVSVRGNHKVFGAASSSGSQ